MDGAGVVGNDLFVVRGPYVYICGLEIANCANGVGLALYNRPNNYFYNNYIHDNWQNGISVFFDTGSSNNQTVIGNIIYRNCKNNSASPHTAIWGSGIGGDRSDAWMIKGNIVTQNWGEGIGPYSSSNNTIDNNIVGDNFSVEIYQNNCGSAVIANNYVFNNNLPSFQSDSGNPADMIAFARESVAPASIALNNEKVAFNICDGGKSGLSYFFGGTSGGLKNSTFNNNIVSHATVADVSIQADAGTTGNVLTRNCFYDLSGSLTTGSAAGFTNSNNRWYNGSAGSFAGSGDNSSNPIGGGTPTPQLSLVVSGLGSAIGEIPMKGQALLLLYTIFVPVNISIPTISGIAKVGQTLTATTGTWTHNPTSFTYQWKRAGTPISGATASTYVPVTGDVGNTLTVSVVAANSGGFERPRDERGHKCG